MPSIADDLVKLAGLRKSGDLTDAEFEVAKAKLLGTPSTEHPRKRKASSLKSDRASQRQESTEDEADNANAGKMREQSQQPLGRALKGNQSEGGGRKNLKRNYVYYEKSNYRGVIRVGGGKFRASITTKGEKTDLGVYDTEEEAARAYDKEAAPLLRRLNFPPPGVDYSENRSRYSKYVGVRATKRGRTWEVTIKLKGKRHTLGPFGSEEEAARAYDARVGPLGRPVNFPQPLEPGADGGMQRKASKEPASKYLGVFWHKAAKRWSAGITVEKRNVHLGYFPDEESAARSYDVRAGPLGRKVNFPEVAPMSGAPGGEGAGAPEGARATPADKLSASAEL